MILHPYANSSATTFKMLVLLNINSKTSQAVRVKPQSMYCLKMTSTYSTYAPSCSLFTYLPRQNSHKSMLSFSCGNRILSAGEGACDAHNHLPPTQRHTPQSARSPTWKKRPSPTSNSPHPAFKDIAVQTRHSTVMAVCVIPHKGIPCPLIIAVAWSVTQLLQPEIRETRRIARLKGFETHCCVTCCHAPSWACESNWGHIPSPFLRLVNMKDGNSPFWPGHPSAQWSSRPEAVPLSSCFTSLLNKKLEKRYLTFLSGKAGNRFEAQKQCGLTVTREAGMYGCSLPAHNTVPPRPRKSSCT